jgi:hypothetical protein
MPFQLVHELAGLNADTDHLFDPAPELNSGRATDGPVNSGVPYRRRGAQCAQARADHRQASQVGPEELFLRSGSVSMALCLLERWLS